MLVVATSRSSVQKENNHIMYTDAEEPFCDSLHLAGLFSSF